MKLCTALVATMLVLAGLSTAHAQMYWDLSDGVAGAGGPSPSGIWDDTSSNWNVDPDGVGSNEAWAPQEIAIFSAGNDATGAFTVTLFESPEAAQIHFEEGDVTLTGGDQLILSSSVPNSIINVASGASGTINSSLSTINGFIKQGTGLLTMGGDSSGSFAGNIDVAQGTLKVTHSGVFGSAGTTDTAGTPTNAVIVRSGATMEIVDGVTVTDRIFANGAGAVRKTGVGGSTIQGGIRFQSEGTSILADAGTLTLRQNAIFRTTGVNAVTFGGAGNIVTTSAAVGGVNTNIAVGSSQVVKVGAGTMTLNGISSWFGGLKILEGVVSYTADVTGAGSQQLGQTSTDGTGATAEYKPAGVILDGGTLRAANTATVFGNNHRGMQIGANGGTVDVLNNFTTIWSSTIRKVPGTETRVTLTKTGIGEFRYNANATQTRVGTDFDQLVVNEGLFRLGSVAGTGLNVEEGFGVAPATPTADAILLNGGALGVSFGVTLHDNRGITVGANGGILNLTGAPMTIPSTVSGAGTLKVIGTQGGFLTGDNSSFTGDIIIGSDTTMFGGITTATAGVLSINSDASLGAVPGAPAANKVSIGTATAAGTLTLSENMTIDSNRGITIGAANGTINVGTSKTADYAGTMTGPGSLTKTGLGTLVLGGNNTYIGTTTSFGGGVLSISSDANLGTAPGAHVANSLTLAGATTGGTLRATSTFSLNANRGITLNNGGATSDAGLGGTIDVLSGETLTVAGVVAGTGRLNKIGSGTLVLTNSNTNTGIVTANAGTIKLDAPSGALADTVPVSLNGTASDDASRGTLDMNNISDTFGSLLSTNGTFGRVLQGIADITLGQTAATTRTFAGSVTGTGTFTKDGGGWTQNLDGDNSLGNVAVNLGRLNFNGMNTTGTVTINDTATLGGTGTVSGAVTVNSGGHVAPGASAGILTVGGATFASGSFFDVEIGGTEFDPIEFDRLAVTGTATINGGTLVPTLINGFTPEIDFGFHILTATSVVHPTDFTIDQTSAPSGTEWQVTYNAGSIELKLASLAAPIFTGDYNDNGTVDAADYVLWRHHNPTETDDVLLNDSTPDSVSEADYDAWVANFGSVESPGSGAGLDSGNTAVPEPSSIALLLVGLAALAARRRGH